METKSIKAFGTEAAEAPLQTLDIQRRAVQAHDVEIEILYCGICHSDLHTARNEWHGTIYPIVPGHEIVGRITKVGEHVKGFKVGDLAGVGCMVDSCRECEHCKNDLEQFCDEGNIQTFNSPDKHLGGQTYGGYSQSITVDESFVLHISDKLNLAAVAPLLCAGITTYSPLKHWKVGPGQKVGIVGIGGLGHMGIKIAKAMGAHVVVFTTSLSKTDDAKRLGADEVVLSTDETQMAQHARSLNFILDCVSAEHNIDAYLNLLKVDGTLTLVGAPMDPLPVTSFSLILGRRSFSGSLIGGIKETQEMLDFCAEHNITSDVEVIGVNDVNEAYERLLKGDVKYRFVIDMESLK
ncbi:putative zinc-type alcohol dehydrogenase-like protein [Flavobacterium nitrogenifigens]|uniref:Zinc-type alcohol dehydrogenase-like protein n=2 Tax=Flavobacterium TaxID=237 RepID=A0ABR6QEZ9_9FLAO|nr:MULTISPECIES: NAD(P)-dependent alcohol dehydrogenase [Flavobacterium]MBB4802843.1 putative zinc-type alcohol dehydrogenase-like protein [Flavobacterium nitrogenifigens]MBB6387801.1 putative zinc-type alcohol dehydrogenase-like protein [Flavobacterium notoginsengisoli]